MSPYPAGIDQREDQGESVYGLSEIWTHKDSSSRHLANALLHLWRSVLLGDIYKIAYTLIGLDIKRIELS